MFHNCNICRYVFNMAFLLSSRAITKYSTQGKAVLLLFLKLMDSYHYEPMDTYSMGYYNLILSLFCCSVCPSFSPDYLYSVFFVFDFFLKPLHSMVTLYLSVWVPGEKLRYISGLSSLYILDTSSHYFFKYFLSLHVLD